MKYGRWFLTAVLAVVLLASVSHAGVAGVFRLPFDANHRDDSKMRLNIEIA